MRLDYGEWLGWPRVVRRGLLLLGVAAVIVESLYEGHGRVTITPWLAYLPNLGHFVLFGGFAVCIALAAGVRLPARRATLGIVAAAAMAGWLDEWHQTTLANRDASLWDLVSDVLGAWFALVVAGWSAQEGGLRARLWPLAGLAAVVLLWNLMPSFGPEVLPPTP